MRPENNNSMHKKGMMVKCVFFSSFSANIPRARRELLNFYSFSTPLAKMACVKRVILSLMQSPRNAEGLSAFQYINKVDNTYIIALAGCLGRVGWLPPNSPDRLPRLHMYDEMKYRLCASNVFLEDCRYHRAWYSYPSQSKQHGNTN